MEQVVLSRGVGLIAWHRHGLVRDLRQQKLSPAHARLPPLLQASLRRQQLQHPTKIRSQAGYYAEDPAQANMRFMVAKRLQETAGYFRRLGSLGFWTQLLCTAVSAGILSFSIAITGTATAPATKYLCVAGVGAGFISMFWSFGYLRLSGKLERAVGDPSKAPQRADVVGKLKTGVFINILGLLSTVMGLQATTGLLVAKALNSPATSFFQGPYAGHNSVVALDVFLIQACANAILSHVCGLVLNLELLRSVANKPAPPQQVTTLSSA